MSTIDVILTLAFFGIGLVSVVALGIYNYFLMKDYKKHCEEMKKWKF